MVFSLVLSPLVGFAGASQILAVKSTLVVARRRPEGSKSTPRTAPLCPLNTMSSSPVAASQMRTVRSWLPVAIRRPSPSRRRRHVGGVTAENQQLLPGGDVPDANLARRLDRPVGAYDPSAVGVNAIWRPWSPAPS